MRLLPRSLFGRLMLVLVGRADRRAAALSAAINLAERDRVLLQASGMQPAQRIADIVALLDSLTPPSATRIVGILNAPPLIVSLDRAPEGEDTADDRRHARGDVRDRAARRARRRPAGAGRRPRCAARGPGAWRGRGPAPGRPGPGRGGAAGFGQGHMGGMMDGPGDHRFPLDGMSFLVQVRLRDGTWASFATPVAPASASLPWRVLLTLAVLLARCCCCPSSRCAGSRGR